MIQIKTFSDDDTVNLFLQNLSEDKLVSIDYKVLSENEEDFSEYFMVVYRT